MRVIHHTNNENTQETLYEMSGRKRVVGDKLQEFCYYLRFQYCAYLAQPGLYPLHHAIECQLRMFPVPFLELLEKVILHFPFGPRYQ
jgi:hypothetical protein